MSTTLFALYGHPEVLNNEGDAFGTGTSAAAPSARAAPNTQVRREMSVGASPRARVDHATATQIRDPNFAQTTESGPQRDQGFWAAREEKLQEWEGRVIAVSSDQFVAQLTDLTLGNEQETERGEFPIAELSESDCKLLRENAVFRWIVGYRYIGATKERFARIVFRRLPAWSAMELQTSRQAPLKSAQEIAWD
jgi:hypothetical protein